MIRTRDLLLAGALLLAAAPAFAQSRTPLVYPAAPHSDTVDDYWGTPVPDPYRPLEHVDAPQTQAWLRAEAAATRRYLDALPYRDRIKTRFRQFTTTWTTETALERHGQFWTVTRVVAGKRAVMFVRDAALQPDRVLLDENALPPAEHVAYVDWSRSGNLIAYGTESGGSDWITWHVRDVASATDLPDVVRWSKYVDVAFAGDDGFYYSGYDAPASGVANDGAPNGVYKAFYHRLGTPQSADLLLACAANSGEFPATSVTADGAYALLLTGTLGDSGYDVFPAACAGRASARARRARRRRRAVLRRQRRFALLFRTTAAAPNGRIIEVDAADPQHRARTMVPERADPLVDARRIGDRFYLDYLHDVHTVLDVADDAGRPLGTIALPGAGTATVPSADVEDDPDFAYYTYESFTQPKTTYRYDLRSGASTPATNDSLPFDARRTSPSSSTPRRRTARASPCSSSTGATCGTTARRRRSCTATAASARPSCSRRRSRGPQRSGSRWAARMRSSTRAAAESSARRGIEPACSTASSTSSTTRSPPRSC